MEFVECSLDGEISLNSPALAPHLAIDRQVCCLIGGKDADRTGGLGLVILPVVTVFAG